MAAKGTYTEWSKLQARNADSLSYWRSTAEGLACDLDSAIEVMAKRVWGRADLASMGQWLSLNYGKHKAVVEARAPLAIAIRMDAQIDVLREALEAMNRKADSFRDGGLFVKESIVRDCTAILSARIAELEKGDANG